MSGVTDVTGGMKYLLQNQDLVMVKVSQDSNGVVTTSLITVDTSNSKLSGTPTTTDVSKCVNTGLFDPKKGAVASESAGRMYDIGTDTIALLNAGDNCDQSPVVTSHAWIFTLADAHGIHGAHVLQSRLQPHGTVYTKVVMGDFNGDGLADPLVFYASSDNGHTEWGMRATTAEDPKTSGSLTIGPELYGNASQVPLAANIVVGDFNGDGRDEIAALLSDNQTIAFYQVDPKSLAITAVADPNNNDQPLTVKLPNLTMVSGQVAIAAGRFRQCGNSSNGTTNVPCPASGFPNADLVVFGQIDTYNGKKADAGYSVIPVKITPQTNNTTNQPSFTAEVVSQSNSGGAASTPYFRFDDKHHSSGALAQAAPLAYWSQPLSQQVQQPDQLVLGIQTQNTASYIEIGTFYPYATLDHFDWESETKRGVDGGFNFLQNMWVGNFDNQNSDGSHSNSLQIETYEVEFQLFVTNHIHIFDVNVPSPLNPPVNRREDWLKQKSDSTSGVPALFDGLGVPPAQNVLSPGDVQGRSLRLGSPTIVRIPKQIQPDLVMAIPPMHVDWVQPYNFPANTLPNCDTPTKQPCVVNISVKPSVPPSNSAVAFATIFQSEKGSTISAKQSSTTSWGVSVKESAGENATFNDGLESASESIKNTTQYAHDHTVSNAYNHYMGTSQQLTTATGFSDFIFYSQKEMNVYYYPVLGCGTPGANCSSDSAQPYVVFSVPDQVVYSEVDGNTQDWYQPVHEPGNVLSYPWDYAQLQKRFSDNVAKLTGPAACMFNGSGSQSTNTTWAQGTTNTNSSGTTNSFSDELSMSYSEGAGVSGVDAADFNFSLDIAGSTSLNTLNEATTSVSSSQGITITKPDFGYTSQCCTYGFGQYIFGLQDKHSASQTACRSGQKPDTDNCIPVGTPGDKSTQVGVGGAGPLFTGYVANPINNVGSELTCSGSQSWWENVYTLPDVALNHPERWNWNRDTQIVTFNANQNANGVSPNDQQFYFMKGFYISKKTDVVSPPLTLPSSPNLAVAKPTDALTLTSRVYDYSLRDAKSVNVRFYGQLYCSGSSGNEASCKNWKTNATCAAGNLCGDSFQIGQDQSIASIPGFESDGNGLPNWQLATVDFLPTDFPATGKGNVNMVFWVVVWMQGSGSKPAAEMQDHGLNTVPGAGITQISQVNAQAHSNNVGMYPVHQPFFISPAGAPGAEAGTGSLKSLALSVSPQIGLDQRTKVVATLQASGAPVASVNIGYYDGDPANNGKLFDLQTITHMDPGVPYYHRSFFVPGTCGSHTLYAKAWLNGSAGVESTAMTGVTLSPVDYVQALIHSTQAANITDATLLNNLLALLNTALQDFQQGQIAAGNNTLGAYMQQLGIDDGGASTSNIGQLTGQAAVILSCGSSGFSLALSPPIATVSSGTAASYALAVTPSGGFTGAVTFACAGAPAGIGCSFSSPSVALDGLNQETVTVTVNSSGVTSAGIAGLPSGPRSAVVKWLLALLLTALAIASLQRARVRQTILGCLIALVIFTGFAGCGGGSGTAGALAPGTYPFTLQATSGKTVQNILLTLVVK